MSKNYFTYNAGTDEIPVDAFRISPSQLSKFLDSTSQWYHEQVLGEAPAFQGSTASELGNCVHAAAEMYFHTKSVDKAAIFAYVDSISNPDVDKSIIRDQLKPMAEVLINQFLSKNVGTHAEMFVKTQIKPGIWAAGSIDMFDANKGIIYDYKTMGSLDTARVPSSFPRSYWFQQLTYAYILRQMGYTVNAVKLVYVSRSNTGRISEKTGKPLKDYPSECNVIHEAITDENMNIIHGVLQVIADSVTLFKEKPELKHVLAQDYRLYQKPAPQLFKD